MLSCRDLFLEQTDSNTAVREGPAVVDLMYMEQNV